MANTGIRAEIIGAKELDAALSQLPKATAKSVLKTAIRKAAKPVEVAAKQLAPVGKTGNLRDSITISVTLKKSQAKGRTKPGAVELYIGAAAGGKRKGYHAHLIEFGTYRTAARPFLRPAWDSNKRKVLDSISKELWGALAKAAKKLAGKAAAGKLSKSAMKALNR